MAEGKRLSKVARECNVGISTIVEFLAKKGFTMDSDPNAKIPAEALELVFKEYQKDQSAKREAEQFYKEHRHESRASISLDEAAIQTREEEPEQEEVLLVQDVRSATKKSSLDLIDEDIVKTEKKEKKESQEQIRLEVEKPAGPKIIGKVELVEPKKKKVEKPKKEEKVEKVEEVPVPVPVPVTATEVKEEIVVAAEVSSEQVIEESPVKTAPVEEMAETTKVGDLIGDVKVVGKIDIDSMNLRTRPPKKSAREKQAEKAREEELKRKKEPASGADLTKRPAEGPATPRKELVKPDEIKTRVQKLTGPTVVGKIVLPETGEKKKATIETDDDRAKKKRKRIRKDRVKVEGDESKVAKDAKKRPKVQKRIVRVEVSEEDVQAQIKDTLARLGSKGKSKTSKYRRLKRDAIRHTSEEEAQRRQEDSMTIKVTEFVTANELASLMNTPVNQIISTCMSLGLFVSINQRLDAETIVIVAEEFGFGVEFISVELQESIIQEEDALEDLVTRPPIVTVMGHVDHGKTSLLDHIRKTNIIAGEAGGITQHIGAYKVVLDNGKPITFLDTPGHEAFTAMRARGAQVTDIAIIVVAADDAVMPQTIEAINHAAAAGVPMVFAINKIDKEGAQPEKIREQLANMNYLLEDWGGKYQSQEISAKKGVGISDLLEKVLLEAEMLDLKANPTKFAIGSVIEATLDKGRGYVTTLLVQAGTLRVGDIMLAGIHFGKVKAMFNERGNPVKEAGPSEPVLVLGLNGAPQAGDKFNVMESEREAREIATKREVLQREQETRTKKHITLDEIGRRIAIGHFQELNLIIKGDVDGSVEALSDSLIKLSTPEIVVNVKHQAVGQISESDVLLASASNAIIVGFQVRPSLGARKLAEKEEVEIRIYSIIYDAINEIKAAMEGMLSPEIKEEITGTLEVLEAFKITKVGTIAGCMVRDGKIFRNSNVRVIRDGIVVYDGLLGSLKRFKDDAREVVTGLECGLNIENFNDIKPGDIIESYLKREIKKTL